jgi:hypothetical protein
MSFAFLTLDGLRKPSWMQGGIENFDVPVQ